jgi:hypothetical protein
MISERMTQFLYRYLDTIFNEDLFDKDEFSNEPSLFLIYGDAYTFEISKILTRINVTADLFHKMHGLFGVSYGDLSDLIRDYLSDKLDYDFSNYPTVPSL